MIRIKIHISNVKLPFYPPCEVKCRLQNRVSTECPSLTELENQISMYERDLTLQLVFNHGECMMHVDKIANGHVIDQCV